MRDSIHAERDKLREAFLFLRASVLRVSTGRKQSTNLSCGVSVSFNESPALDSCSHIRFS